MVAALARAPAARRSSSRYAVAGRAGPGARCTNTIIEERKPAMFITRRGLIGTLAAAALLAGNIGQAAEGTAKRIMVYGDSNTWGYIPVESGTTTRYPEDVRWTGVFRAALGPGYEVIDEGLSARTTDLPDPSLPQSSGTGLDGSAYLPAAVATHLPLDLALQLRFGFEVG